MTTYTVRRYKFNHIVYTVVDIILTSLSVFMVEINELDFCKIFCISVWLFNPLTISQIIFYVKVKFGLSHLSALN